MTRPSFVRGIRPIIPLAIACAMTTAGCYQGFNGTVNAQPPTGNGTDFVVGDGLAIQDTTIVAGDAKAAAMSFTMVNNGPVADQLVNVVVQPSGKTAPATPIDVKSKAVVKVGGPGGVPIQFTDFPVPAGNYAEVIFNFKEAGSVTQQIAVVPNLGYYASYGPTIAPSPTPAATRKRKP